MTRYIKGMGFLAYYDRGSRYSVNHKKKLIEIKEAYDYVIQQKQNITYSFCWFIKQHVLPYLDLAYKYTQEKP